MLLKERRKLAHLTVKELAERAGVSPGTVRRIERGGHKQLRLVTIQRISNALGLRPSEVDEFSLYSRELS